jgi:hypothetical protein
MRRFSILAITVGIVSLANSPLLAQPRRPRGDDMFPTTYGWLSSLQAGKAEAARSGKPLMVVIRCVP